MDWYREKSTRSSQIVATLHHSHIRGAEEQLQLRIKGAKLLPNHARGKGRGCRATEPHRLRIKLSTQHVTYYRDTSHARRYATEYDMHTLKRAPHLLLWMRTTLSTGGQVAGHESRRHGQHISHIQRDVPTYELRVQRKVVAPHTPHPQWECGVSFLCRLYQLCTASFYFAG